ncbi:glycosyltransferase family 2 protein [bacterium]|jgi:glycosyltransferase involved in cell wall biosynthesis|nr:glycosyltransferase family 2 protein [bacterium]
MKISVVMAAYNEKETIKKIMESVLSVKNIHELIVVDDGSNDGTTETLERINNPKVIKLFSDKNYGKGHSLRKGFEKVTGDVVIIQDADLEYNPAEYEKLVAPIIDGKADVVFGSRFIGVPHRVLFFWHYIGNRFLTLLSNALTNINLTDMETCYKAFKSSILSEVKFKSQRFGFEPEFTAKMARKGYRIYETSISYSGRDYKEGKKITWKDGIAAIGHILRFNLFDR